MSPKSSHALWPTQKTRVAAANARTGVEPDEIARAIVDNLRCLQGKLPRHATRHDWYMALAYSVRDRLLDRSLTTAEAIADARSDRKLVAYVSAEFLIGPHLGNSLMNLGIRDAVDEAVFQLGQRLSTLLDEEEEPGLGCGGPGRVAACYMDSLATLNVPAIGYGIRYEFGIFDQEIRDGWQIERTDKWLRFGNPWEIPRSDVEYHVKFGGHTESRTAEDGRLDVSWQPSTVVRGIAFDTPVPGYGASTTNVLRLWQAEAVESFEFEAFRIGDYYRAVDEKVASESITKVLHPNDEPDADRRARLAQQYFLVSCALQDIIRLHLMRGKQMEELSDGWAMQLNDTAACLAVAELMRLLVDEHHLGWDAAWTITQRTTGFTVHTLLSDAFDRWPVPLFASLLPRLLEIIYEINRRFLDDVRARQNADEALVARMSLIDENGERFVRMAHLASIGSHAVNGVAAIHTERLERTALNDFHRLWPQRFWNVTSGVSPRRWVALSNPALAALITRHIGSRWIAELEHEIDRIEPLADDIDFQAAWQSVKTDNKRALADLIKDRLGIVVNPGSLFDVHVKRVHEHKRQHLTALHAITLYNRMLRGDTAATVPRTILFGGKAAPGDWTGKLIIRLIHGVASVINGDRRVSDALKVVFLPDFNVRTAQRVYPAADLSEQIAISGREPCATGSMKAAMNGALTIGTPDSTNIEIRDAVGHDNFFLFGLTADAVASRLAGAYTPRLLYETDPELREALGMIAAGVFSDGDTELFRPLIDTMVTRDASMVLADYRAYVETQERVSDAFGSGQSWERMSIVTAARMGRFSSDRAVRQYCLDIWNVRPRGCERTDA
jgi:starch phosphorylase